MKQVCALLVLGAVIGTAIRMHAEDNKMEETWGFQRRNGVVEIKLIRFVDKKVLTSLNIYSPDGASRSVAG